MTTPPQSTRSLSRNIFVLFSTQIVLKLLSLVVGVLLANTLDVAHFGQYNYVFAYTSLFIPLLDIGVDTFVVREIAAGQSDYRLLTGTSFVLKVVCSVIGFGAMIAVAALLPNAGGILHLVMFGGIVTIVRAVAGTFSAVFRGVQRMELEARTSLVAKVLEVAAIGIGIILHTDIQTLFLLLIVSSILQVAFSALTANRAATVRDLGIDRAVARHLIRGGLPFVLTGISVMIYFQIDSVMLSLMVGETAVGIYRSASNLVFAGTTFSGAIVIALFPKIAQLNELDRPRAIAISSEVLSYSLLLSLPLAVLTTILGSPIIAFLYKSSYSSAVLTLQIIVWWLPLSYVTNVIGNVLGGIRLQQHVLFVAVINAVFNVSLNLYFIPHFQDKGAAMTTVATELLGLVLLTWIIRRKFGQVFDRAKILRVFGAQLFLVPIWFLRSYLPLIPLVVLAIVAYGFGVVLVRAVEMKDVESLVKKFFRPVRAS